MGGSEAERRGPRAQVDAYLAELAGRAREVLGERLVGVYAGGSLALGAYEHGRSDLDMAVVVEGRLERRAKKELVAALRHEALPCPARGLELVVYSRAAAAAETVEVDFELNLNTGRAMAFRADFAFDPEVGSHWFAIDRAILRECALAVAGRPAGEVFAEIPRSLLLPVVVESLRWHESGEALGDDAVLNACRALRYARTASWTSKPEAGRWALEHGVGDVATIEAAFEARAGGAPVAHEKAAAFVSAAAREVAGAFTDR
jgi:Domain of unknown function (DUF4111)